MKKSFTIIATILFITTGCRDNTQSTDDFITVDVTVNYPKKELILQDFMDVEYIPLETNDEFITAGYVQALGKEAIIVRNSVRDGNIFVFNRNDGKSIRKINRFGQGSEEYSSIVSIVLDEENNVYLSIKLKT
ncbi:hypothetical protein AGMMS49574_05980 [Bacteroidia bacterium]|nr:hypothetical protein AGMMS49574_05980 [Bacteroidia bacterium]